MKNQPTTEAKRSCWLDDIEPAHAASEIDDWTPMTSGETLRFYLRWVASAAVLLAVIALVHVLATDMPAVRAWLGL